MNHLNSLYLEMESHLLKDVRPSEYLKTVYEDPLFEQQPFYMLYQLRTTEQSPKHHPEGNVWNHTLLVVDQAAKVKHRSKDQRAFMWAALLHDIGKPPATKVRNGKITAYNHDKVGAEMARKFLSYFTEEKEWIYAVCALVRYHMQILFVVNHMPFADINGMKQSTDVEEIALLGLCDRLGRGGCNRKEEEKNIQRFLELCR